MRIFLRHVIVVALVPLVLVATLGSGRSASAFDYIGDGGFEFGGASWLASPSVDFDTVGDDVVGPREGAHSGRLVVRPGAATFSIRQRILAGAPPGVYHFAAWVRTTNRSTEVYAQLTNDATADTVKVVAAQEESVWSPLTADIAVAGDAEVVVTIAGRGEPGDVVYVDGVQLEGASPVTATATMHRDASPSAASVSPTSTKTPQQTETPTSTDTPVPEAIGSRLRNAGFESTDEDGLPSAWRTYGGTASTTTSSVHGGARAARYESTTASTKWLYQTVRVSAGRGYGFDAWLRIPDGAVASASLRISWYASDDGTGRALATADSLSSLAAPAAEYERLTTGAAPAPPDARSARLRILLSPLSEATASILIDDTSFGEAEPAADAGTAFPARQEPAAANLVLGEAQAPSPSRAERVRATGRAPATRRNLVINEVMYNPTGEDDAEWIELYNPSNDQISLAGWTVADGAGADSLPEIQIAAHQFAVIAASDSFLNAFPDYKGALRILGARIGNGLGNAGDRLELRDPTGATADAISWGDDATVLRPSIEGVPTGHSIERRATGIDSDAATDWVDNMRPSPGAGYAPARASYSANSNSNNLEPLASSSRLPITWLAVAACALILAAAVSWRAAPVISERLRRQP